MRILRANFGRLDMVITLTMYTTCINRRRRAHGLIMPIIPFSLVILPPLSRCLQPGRAGKREDNKSQKADLEKRRQKREEGTDKREDQSRRLPGRLDVGGRSADVNGRETRRSLRRARRRRPAAFTASQEAGRVAQANGLVSPPG